MMQQCLCLFVTFLIGTAHAFFVMTSSSSRPCPTTQLAALAPNQIKLLRKEASQRLARKSLAQVFLPEEDTESSHIIANDDETNLETILQLLHQHELVQVRGISRNNIRHVYAETQQMILELNLLVSDSQQRMVELVETSGFSSILYAPADPPKIILRTSYKEGQWSKKPKKPRDIRGQIIVGADSSSDD